MGEVARMLDLPEGTVKSHLHRARLALDSQLRAAISPPHLSPGFRASLLKKIARAPVSAWPDLLPDAAHLIGGIFATALCLFMLPFSAGTVVLAGLAFTLVTYLVQTALRTSLESFGEDSQE